MSESKKTFVNACTTEVEVTTNTPMGGDSGHGGRTVVRITDQGSTDMHDSHVELDKFGDVTEIVLAFGGDAEAHVLADALTWAGQELHRQIEDNKRRA